jgi:hypothetical protein
MFVRCTFVNNSALKGIGIDNSGGAVMLDTAGTVGTFISCIFIGNFASQTGGAVNIVPGATGIFTNCSFQSNTSPVTHFC